MLTGQHPASTQTRKMVFEKEVATYNDPEEEEEEEEDEEDLVDPHEELMEKCGNSAECKKYKDELQACEDRVNSKSSTEETCDQELYDFLHARDHLVAHKVMNTLK